MYRYHKWIKIDHNWKCQLFFKIFAPQKVSNITSSIVHLHSTLVFHFDAILN